MLTDKKTKAVPTILMATRARRRPSPLLVAGDGLRFIRLDFAAHGHAGQRLQRVRVFNRDHLQHLLLAVAAGHYDLMRPHGDRLHVAAAVAAVQAVAVDTTGARLDFRHVNDRSHLWVEQCE